MIRIHNKADRKYIENLLDEMEKDENFYYELQVDEHRQDGIIGNIQLTARRIDECSF